MLKTYKTNRPREYVNQRRVKLVGKFRLSHNGELGSFTERTTYLALSLHKNKKTYDGQDKKMTEESGNAHRSTVGKLLENRSMANVRGNAKMHHREICSDIAGCMITTHDRVL
jgi:hypothetical protein